MKSREHNLRKWAVLCDFDGTIALDDVTDSLLERFGRPGWEVLEQDWRSGRIGSRDCMAGQVALLDCSRAQLDEHLATVEIDVDFPRFVSLACELGIGLEVVSDGLDYVVRSVLRRHGLGHLRIIANRLLQVGPRAWKLAFPYGDAQCRTSSGTCKCARAALHARQHAAVVAVGDGASDYCLASRASIVLAKSSLVEHCRREGILHRSFANFRAASEHLTDLAPDSLTLDSTCTSSAQLRLT